MHVIIITGFLGSGKTTLLTKIAQRASDKGLKAGIVVNEVGKVAIDDQFMKRLGHSVWEIMGGCVCCTLKPKLVDTLKVLKRDHDIDLILVEPSGTAEPGEVISIFEQYHDDSANRRYQVALLDPLNLDTHMEVYTPLTTSTIKGADLILVTKGDVSSREQVEYSVATARQENPDVPVFVVSSQTDLEPACWEELEKWLP